MSLRRCHITMYVKYVGVQALRELPMADGGSPNATHASANFPFDFVLAIHECPFYPFCPFGLWPFGERDKDIRRAVSKGYSSIASFFFHLLDSRVEFLQLRRSAEAIGSARFANHLVAFPPMQCMHRGRLPRMHSCVQS